MGKTKEESLTNVNKKNIFTKLKMFFKRIIGNKEQINNSNIETENEINANREERNFKESIKNIEDNQTELLQLQKKFRNGEIKKGDLSQEQIDRLCELYDSQIESLKNSIEMRRKRIEEYRNKNKKV